MGENFCGRLQDDCTRKRRGPCEKQQRAHFHIPLSLHLAENMGIEGAKREIETDREEDIRVIVEIRVLSRTLSKLREYLVSYKLDHNHAGHVYIEEKIAAEGLFFQRAHQHRGFAKDAYEPD
jgi:hypothetical protein